MHLKGTTTDDTIVIEATELSPAGIVRAPLPSDNSIVAQGEAQRSDQLADLLSRPETYGDIGVEFILLVRLMADGGKCAGDWDQIGRLVATDGRSVKRWADKLEKSGRITVMQLTQKKLELRLTSSPAPRASRLPVPHFVPADETPVHRDADPELDRLVNLYRAAKQAGCPVKLEIVETFGNAKAR